MKKLTIILIFLFISTGFTNAQWEECTGLSGKLVMCIAAKGDTIFAGTNGEGVFVTTDMGDTWAQKNSGLVTLYINCIAIKDSFVFVGTPDGFLTSTNFGDSWIENNLRYTIESIVISNDDIFCGSFSLGLIFSSDNGKSWTDQKENIIIQSSKVLTVSVNKNDIYTGTLLRDIFVSTDYGSNWTEKNNGIPDTRITIIAIKDENVFAGTYDGIFHTTNKGDLWVANNNGLTKLGISSFAFFGNNIFCGSGGGVFLSKDNGNFWSERNQGLNNLVIYPLTISGNYIFAGTTNGIFKAYIPKLIITDIKDVFDKSTFDIFQNLSTSTIEVEFKFQHEGTAQIIITNSYGQQVYNTNVNYINSEQEQKLSIDISSFPSGLYFVTLRSPAVALTKGVVVLN